MKAFHYIVRNPNGTESQGIIRALTQAAAVKKLQKDSIILSLTPQVNPKSYWRKPHLNLEEKLMFTKHMATMLKAGVTVLEGIEILMSQTSQPENHRMYENIIERIKTGETLAKSLRAYPKVFSEIFVSMIATGESSGTLQKVFEYLDIQLEKEYELRRKIVSAFIYPGVIISITLLLSLGIVIFIMPKITEIFISFDVVLPLPTRVLIGFSSFILNHPFMAVGIVFFSIFGSRALVRSKTFKPTWQKILFHLPIFGKLLIYANLARFSRTMNSLLQAGVPITEALTIVSNVIENGIYKNAILRARDKVQQGGKLGESFMGYEKIFPSLLTKMITIGESTGSLESTTAHLSELYERNVDNITKNLSVLLEPLLLIFMGLLIGGIALSIILPIYQLPNLLSH